MYARFFKRCRDVLFSILGLVLLAVPMLIIMLIVYIDDPGPVLFFQERLGRYKKPFMIIKFRTMRMDAPHDMPTNSLKAPRKWITRVGWVLRRTSLDELPQMVNILKGDMSFIGPRPALPCQTDLILLRDANGANDVLPGLSGLAQINGRDELSTQEKAEQDGEYVRRMSYWFDWKCFLDTFSSVIHHRGVLEGGEQSPGSGGEENNKA